jgi:hypothetical protein
MKMFYRPVTVSIIDKSYKSKEFDNLTDCFNFIIEENRDEETRKLAGAEDDAPFDLRALSVRCFGYNEYIHTVLYVVCTDRYFDEVFKETKAIGFLTFE